MHQLKKVGEVLDFSSEVTAVSVCLAMGTQIVETSIFPVKVW
jgi:hypothetical protein